MCHPYKVLELYHQVCGWAGVGVCGCESLEALTCATRTRSWSYTTWCVGGRVWVRGCVREFGSKNMCHSHKVLELDHQVCVCV